MSDAHLIGSLRTFRAIAALGNDCEASCCNRQEVLGGAAHRAHDTTFHFLFREYFTKSPKSLNSWKERDRGFLHTIAIPFSAHLTRRTQHAHAALPLPPCPICCQIRVSSLRPRQALAASTATKTRHSATSKLSGAGKSCTGGPTYDADPPAPCALVVKALRGPLTLNNETGTRLILLTVNWFLSFISACVTLSLFAFFELQP